MYFLSSLFSIARLCENQLILSFQNTVACNRIVHLARFFKDGYASVCLCVHARVPKHRIDKVKRINRQELFPKGREKDPNT